MKKFSREIKILAALLLPVIFVLVLHHYITGFTVYNDGTGYYGYVRSAVIDRDLDFENELTDYTSSQSKFSSAPKGSSIDRSQSGEAKNIYSIGSSLMWLPLFLVAHVTTIFLGIVGMNVIPNGYGVLYEGSVGISSIIFGFIGLWFTYKLCRKWFDKKISLLATVGVWYGTSLFWYHAVEPSMAHINSFFLNSVFIYFWYITLGKRRLKGWFFLGFLGLMVFLVRQQEAIILLLPAVELLKNTFGAIKNKVKRNKIIVDNVKNGIALVAGMVPLLLLQALVWKNLFGQFLVYSYSTTRQDIGRWTYPHILPLLFSSEGMIITPAMLLGFLGLFLFAKKRKFVGGIFLAIVLLQILVTSSWSGWNTGYGLRFLLGLSPLLALGIAQILEVVKNKVRMRYVYAFVGLLIVINFISMLMFLLKEVSGRTPISEIPKVLLEILL